jgi:hypothetical protein
VARAVETGSKKTRRAKPENAAERRLERAAAAYADALKEIERRYARLVDAIRAHDEIPRRRAAELTGLSRSRIQQIIEEQR